MTAHQEIETYPGEEASTIAALQSFPRNRTSRFVVYLSNFIDIYQVTW